MSVTTIGSGAAPAGVAQVDGDAVVLGEASVPRVALVVARAAGQL